MPIRFKFDVLARMKEKGYNTSRLRKEKILGEATIQSLRSGGRISVESLGTICKVIGCQPGDILEYVPDDGESEK